MCCVSDVNAPNFVSRFGKRKCEKSWRRGCIRCHSLEVVKEPEQVWQDLFLEPFESSELQRHLSETLYNCIEML